MIVLGGGAIGVELAQVFARFRCAVTVVEGQERLLSQEEPEAGELAEEVLRADGVAVLTSVRARQVGHDGTGFIVHLEGEEEPLRAERLLVATGRRADLAELGVDAAGLDPSARAVRTDGQMRAEEGLWAIGDVTGRGNFTHVSMYQAEIAVRDILGRPGLDADYRALPASPSPTPRSRPWDSPSGRRATSGCKCAPAWCRSPPPHAAGSTGGATRGSSNWSRMPTEAC